MCTHYLCHLLHCCVTISLTTLKLRSLYLRNLGMGWLGCLGLSKLKLRSRMGRASCEAQVVVADLVSSSCRDTISFLDASSQLMVAALTPSNRVPFIYNTSIRESSPQNPFHAPNLSKFPFFASWSRFLRVVWFDQVYSEKSLLFNFTMFHYKCNIPLLRHWIFVWVSGRECVDFRINYYQASKIRILCI
jgi:hypothetical protein